MAGERLSQKFLGAAAILGGAAFIGMYGFSAIEMLMSTDAHDRSVGAVLLTPLVTAIAILGFNPFRKAVLQPIGRAVGVR